MMKIYFAIMAMAFLATSMSVMAATNSTGVPSFVMYNWTTKTINASVGGVLNIRSPKGFNMSLSIPPGTYVNVSNTISSSYYVTLSTFRVANVLAPAAAPNDTPKSAFLIQINGKVIQSKVFTNSSGVPKAVTFTVNHVANWTSFSYLNATVNGTGFTGGAYGNPNKWVYNTTSGTMSDVSIEKAQMHIYELMPGPASKYITTTTSTVATTSTLPTTAPRTSIPATTVATTIAATTIAQPVPTSSGNGTLWIVAIVVIAILVIAAAAMMRKKGPKKR